MQHSTSASEAARLEGLWAGEFGDEYVDRNLNAYDARRPFWQMILDSTGARSVCEVGCNVGGNLRWISPPVPAAATYGVDVNMKALRTLTEIVPGVNALHAP
ncbi:MAG TPA: hypothetical protein VFR41_00545, partial [Acidimicrobiia bacterium]|nr:hypothetical protein [Acidimicrobiia bacterium]